jgi:LmbE family N-acetylglucosaminyl deacetylase
VDRVIVVAPHPDDETLGAGGALLRHRDLGDEVHWLIVTQMEEPLGFSVERIDKRKKEIEKVAAAYRFAQVHQAKLPTTQLDTLPVSTVVSQISGIFQEVKPTVVYLPFSGDVHSDHRVVSDAVLACCKWFRYPSIKRVLAYETLSETDQDFSHGGSGFKPNCYVNISKYLDKKIEIMSVYEGELGEFPFPRSERALRALAEFRGVQVGYQAAEAFLLLKECVS